MAGLAFAAGVAAQADELAALQARLPRVLEQAGPWLATVQIYGGIRPGPPAATGPATAPASRPAPRRAPQAFPVARGATTGVILSADGWIAASLWSLQLEPVAVVVTLADGRKFAAETLGRDFSRGLGLLKVDAQNLPLPAPAPPGSVRPGHWVLALGRTFGPGTPEAALGIVSALDRLGRRAVQTDAAVSPSCYGGALVDLEGRIIGILAPLSPQGYAAGIQWYDSGIGFAAAWDGLLRVLPRLKAGEDLHPGRLGVALEPVDLGPGALVREATGPAAKAGLGRGDRIVEYAGERVRHSFHLEELVAAGLAGDRVALKVVRQEKESVLEATLERRGLEAPAEGPIRPPGPGR